MPFRYSSPPPYVLEHLFEFSQIVPLRFTHWAIAIVVEPVSFVDIGLDNNLFVSAADAHSANDFGSSLGIIFGSKATILPIVAVEFNGDKVGFGCHKQNAIVQRHED